MGIDHMQHTIHKRGYYHVNCKRSYHLLEVYKAKCSGQLVIQQKLVSASQSYATSNAHHSTSHTHIIQELKTKLELLLLIIFQVRGLIK